MLNARHPIWQIPNATLITIGESWSANANGEFLAVLLDQLLNKRGRDFRPTLNAIIQRLANYLVKNCALIFDHNCFDAGSTNIESDRCLRLHLDRFVEGKTRCNQKRLLLAQTDMIIREWDGARAVKSTGFAGPCAPWSRTNYGGPVRGSFPRVTLPRDLRSVTKLLTACSPSWKGMGLSSDEPGPGAS
jgi:hypothetical protein